MLISAGDRKFWVGIGISAVCLLLLFLKIDFQKLLAAFHDLDGRFLVPAILFTFISYFFRAVRWRTLLAPLKRTGLGNLFSATIIGYMANNLLPARLGEFIRAYVLGDTEGIDKSSVFATLVIDRLYDGFTVLLILITAFFSVTLPAGMEQVQKGLAVGGYLTLGLYTGVILFLVVLKRRTAATIHFVGVLLRPFPERVSGKLIPLLGSFIDGVRFPRRFGEMGGLFLSSLVIWLFALLPVDMVLRSFNINLPLTASMFILVFLVFAVMVPASPGYIGTYHAACVYGLMAFNISMERAMSVAIVIHSINFFPVTLAGFYFLWRNKISLKNIDGSSIGQEH